MTSYSKLEFKHTRLLIKLQGNNNQFIPKFIFCHNVTPTNICLTQLTKEDKEKEEWCKLFEPTLTSNGVCETFNSKPFSNIYKASNPVVESFQKIYKPETKLNLRSPTGFGPDSGINLILDQKTFLIPKTDLLYPLDMQRNFLLQVGNGDNIFDVARKAILVKPGYKTTVHVFVSEVQI